ncbi:MAG: hypothetical protein LLG97_08905 [Deltaproteobacteria bacterium]|nr:hypothetical protein [Deltaproteobacteria bacterium]
MAGPVRAGEAFREDRKSRAPMIFGLSRDVAERPQERAGRKASRERLHRAEKMEALGRLTGGVAHDLNNVLGVACLYSELLQGKMAEDDPLRPYATQISTSIEQAAAIIRDLLALSGRELPTSRTVNLDDVISACLKAPEFENLRALHPGVTFRTESGGEQLDMPGIPSLLEKCVMNLVSNALEAIPARGEVTIATQKRQLVEPVSGYDTVEEGDYVVLAVRDTGMGITPGDVKKIFEPFYTKKTVGRGGTGLGLTVVREIVKGHHGYVEVRSRVGEGTRFTLYFPAAGDGETAEGAR